MNQSVGSITTAAAVLLAVLGLVGASPTFAQGGVLPKDVNRSSRSRLPLLNLEDVSPRARRM